MDAVSTKPLYPRAPHEDKPASRITLQRDDPTPMIGVVR